MHTMQKMILKSMMKITIRLLNFSPFVANLIAVSNKINIEKIKSAIEEKEIALKIRI